MDTYYERRSKESAVETIPAAIPMPDVLDAERVLLHDSEDLSEDECRERANQLERALRDSCAYAQQLWHELWSVRRYLIAVLPPEPGGQPLAARRGANPEGPSDESGWSAWCDAYASVTSALEGPRGDAGFAVDEAHRIADERRG
jgi:thioesterase domain-containing protein